MGNVVCRIVEPSASRNGHPLPVSVTKSTNRERRMEIGEEEERKKRGESSPEHLTTSIPHERRATTSSTDDEWTDDDSIEQRRLSGSPQRLIMILSLFRRLRDLWISKSSNAFSTPRFDKAESTTFYNGKNLIHRRPVLVARRTVSSIFFLSVKRVALPTLFTPHDCTPSLLCLTR